MTRIRERFGRSEAGQAVVLVALLLVPLLSIAGLAIDVGYAYYAQRSLQKQAEAAALAGAQNLPDSAKSVSLAKQYGSSSKNRQNDLGGTVNEQVTTKCLSSVPLCSPVNAVVVDETANVPTLFSRVVGFHSLKVHVRGMACSPCGLRPLDIVVVLDRTGSMCMTHSGASDPSCADLNNARNGILSFLGLMNEADYVGLGVFPPASSISAKCSTPGTSNYNSKSSPYVVVPLAKDFVKNGKLDNNSNLVKTAGATSCRRSRRTRRCSRLPRPRRRSTTSPRRAS
ncbi:MAG: pilus assembly protein TadG-related protein [Actinomycetota bacterium]|nr:pilus assembly protein TadG-related protein [Actinomycetota bacterium]